MTERQDVISLLWMYHPNGICNGCITKILGFPRLQRGTYITSRLIKAGRCRKSSALCRACRQPRQTIRMVGVTSGAPVSEHQQV